jgi:hypothetical protein
MKREAHELARLQRRIADVRHAIQQARDDRGWPGNTTERARTMVLLKATLSALEARMAEVQGTRR